MKLKELLNQVLAEGVYDPNIFKAIFVVGSPGSGKSYVVKRLGLEGYGLKLVDSDVAFVHMLKKVTNTLKLDTIPNDVKDPIRTNALDITDRIGMKYAEGRLGLIISGTAADIEKVKSKRDQLVELGYDTYILFVNTDLETALARNAKRERSIPEDAIRDKWRRYHANIGELEGMFGFGKHKTVDNLDGNETAINDAAKYIKIWMRDELGQTATNWIRNQIRNKNRKGA